MEEFEAPAAATKSSVFAKIAALSTKVKVIAASALVVLVGGGSAFAYSALQSPDAVVGLALASAFSGSHPSGNLDVKATGILLNGDASMDIYTADSGDGLKLKLAATMAGQPIGATLNYVAAKNGDMYVNLADFDTLGTYLTNSGMLSAQQEALYAHALNGVWVKVAKADLDQYSGGNTCLSGKLDNADYTKALGAELQNTLRNNLFIVPTKELPGVNGDRVFNLGISADKLKGFLHALKTTKYYGDLQTCLPGFNINDSDINSISQSQIDSAFKQAGITVSLYAKGGWSPTLDKLVVTDAVTTGEKLTFTYTPGGDQSSKVVVPTKSITVQQLITTLLNYPY